MPVIARGYGDREWRGGPHESQNFTTRPVTSRIDVTSYPRSLNITQPILPVDFRPCGFLVLAIGTVPRVVAQGFDWRAFGAGAASDSPSFSSVVQRGLWVVEKIAGSFRQSYLWW